jgi:hypothetical protein
MGLGLPHGSEGDFIPYCSYNAKAGRWSNKDDAGDIYELDEFKNIAADLENIKTGYFKFMEGQAPDKQFDSAAGANDVEKPSDQHKRGFQFLVFSKKLGGVREFSSTAGVVNAEINKLYDAFEEEKGNNAGKVPIITCTGIEPVKSKHGTNYAPQMRLVKWANRPVEFDEDAAKQRAALSEVAPPKSEDEDDDEF